MSSPLRSYNTSERAPASRRYVPRSAPAQPTPSRRGRRPAARAVADVLPVETVAVTAPLADVPEAEPSLAEAPPADASAPPAVTDTAPPAEAKAESGPVVGVNDFEEIFARFQTPLVNFVYRLVGNREQAFDLTQDVFVKAYKALSGGTTIQAAALSSWLYRIASNTATDALRRRRLINWLPLSLFNEDRGVGAGMPGLDTSSSAQGSSDDSYPGSAMSLPGGYDGGRFEQHVADRELVNAVLQKLPEKYRSCLLLYEHEGFSCAEIANIMNLSSSAVKMRLMRARERFIALYRQEIGKQQ